MSYARFIQRRADALTTQTAALQQVRTHRRNTAHHTRKANDADFLVSLIYWHEGPGIRRSRHRFLARYQGAKPPWFVRKWRRNSFVLLMQLYDCHDLTNTLLGLLQARRITVDALDMYLAHTPLPDTLRDRFIAARRKFRNTQQTDVPLELLAHLADPTTWCWPRVYSALSKAAKDGTLETLWRQEHISGDTLNQLRASGFKISTPRRAFDTAELTDFLAGLETALATA